MSGPAFDLFDRLRPDVIVEVDTPQGTIYLACFDRGEPWEGEPEAHARSELLLRTAWRNAPGTETFPLECERLRALHPRSPRRWVSCAGCGRPFWLAPGEPIGPHSITDDPRLARPCATPQEAPAVK